MPKLLAFLACEKIIADEDGSVSLIALLRNIRVAVGKEGIPKNALTPKEWAIFTLWQPSEPGDVGKTFHQAIQLLWPDGSEFTRSNTEFKVEQGKTNETRVKILGFPAGQAGKLTLNTWLEEKSPRGAEVYSYTVDVSHNRTS